MNEDFLQYIWKFQLFNKVNLFTTSGIPIDILNPGKQNEHAGPDFFNAKIRIGDTVWAGNVEVHLKASDWIKHHHQTNKSYDNVILHVVFNNDSPVKRNNGEVIPTLELKDIVIIALFNQYQQLLNNKAWVACESFIKNIDDFIIKAWLNRLLIERMERKAGEITRFLEKNNNNIEQTFYEFLAQWFGSKYNAEPFFLMAQSLPQNILARHKNNVNQIEALIFGQAGFLNEDFKDDYPRELAIEYKFLKNKYSLVPNEKHLWKFLRLRPANFPTIRLAQFAQLIYKSTHLFSKIIENADKNAIAKLLDVETAAYWENHYVFDKPSTKKIKKLGADAVDLIIINAIVPFIFAYAHINNVPTLIDKGIALLDDIEGEHNQIIYHWQTLGMPIKSASETQALLELKNNYCQNKKCLSCNLGNHILRSKLN